MEGLVRRITPMAVLDDIEPALARYLALGFERVGDTGDPGCVGIRAKDGTAMIFVTTAFLGGEFGPAAIEGLAGLTLPYIWVVSLDRAERLLPETAEIVGRIESPSIRESLARVGGDWLMLAETLRPTPP